MARLFDDAGPDFLRVETPVRTAPPFTISLRFRTNNLDVGRLEQTMFWFGNVGSGIHDYQLRIRQTDPEVFYRGQDASTTFGVDAGNNVVLNKWHNVVAVEVSTSSHKIYFDGVFKQEDTLTVDPIGEDRTSIGAEDDGTVSRGMSGDIAHIAVWNAILIDNLIASLAAGASPLRVYRDALIHYWPVGGQNPELDIVGGLNMTINGTPTQSEEPPIPYSVVAPG